MAWVILLVGVLTLATFSSAFRRVLFGLIAVAVVLAVILLELDKRERQKRERETEEARRRIPITEIEVVDLLMTGSGGGTYISGRIRNKSDRYTLTGVALHVVVQDCIDPTPVAKHVPIPLPRQQPLQKQDTHQPLSGQWSSPFPQPTVQSPSPRPKRDLTSEFEAGLAQQSEAGLPRAEQPARCETVGETDAFLLSGFERVPPHQARDFRQSVSFPLLGHAKGRRQWSYMLVSSEGR